MLTIIGLGAGDLDSLTLKAYRRLEASEQIYLRTSIHPAAKDLQTEGLEFSSFDYLYETKEEFSAIYEEISSKVIELLATGESLVYAVPGHPLVAEKSVDKLLAKLKPEDYELLAAPSFLDLLYTRLEIDPTEGLKLLDGLDFNVYDLDPRVDTIISQVYNQSVASKVKLSLMDVYPDQYEIKVLRGLGLEKERVETIELYKLDRLDWIDHLTSIYLPADKTNPTQLSRLVEIMELLRSEQGCPWDREQDYNSLKEHLLEESYEVIERVDREDYFGLEEELGDLLLQIVFYCQLATERGEFSIREVIAGIVTKLIRRHPHVFAEREIKSSSEVLENWQAIKKEEKGSTKESLLAAIPFQLPSLLEAQEIQSKVAEVGFDWPTQSGVTAKLEEELDEFLEVVEAEGSEKELEAEFGDLLFSLVNLARHLSLDAETSLLATINKFRARFSYLESELKAQGKELTAVSLEKMDELWEEAKKLGREDK